MLSKLASTVSSSSSSSDEAGETGLTTNTSLRITNDQDSLKAGVRGPTLMEDFYFREKITHFDHERIPERVVHARGSGAHGYFQCYHSLEKYTKAKFLTDTSLKTPVFVRFSTVLGSRGSTDLARDVRGFATKFYTDEGVFDLVGNNIPVFFVQDAIKFPDIVHAAKPHPHWEIPQAQTAHDNFWDFVSIMPESTHMLMWVMSDRAIPRSYRMMEGFGVNTFRLVNAEGKSVFVKFHWKPTLGVHSVLWEEALEISGKDPDFHRRDLWEAIESGAYPSWDLGVQIVEEADEHKFDFDLLDDTKIIPEEMVPVIKVGKLVLDRNPDNFFAETEQVAFCPSNVVPGIAFSDDPLLQGRLFSYFDTQLTRLGGPNFQELPINKSRHPVNNNEQDGFMRHTVMKTKVNYSPNTLGGGCPFQMGMRSGGYDHFNAKLEAAPRKVRGKGKKFFDHFSQARMFLRSQTPIEQLHMLGAFSFELGRCNNMEIRQRMVRLLSIVDEAFASKLAHNIGVKFPVEMKGLLNYSYPADADPQDYQPLPIKDMKESPAVSIVRSLAVASPVSRKIAILVADGYSESELTAMKAALVAAQAIPMVVGLLPAPTVSSNTQSSASPDFSVKTASSVLFDALFIPGDVDSVNALKQDPDALTFVATFYKHCKAIGACGAGVDLVRGLPLDEGVVTSSQGFSATFAATFLTAVASHRVWDRELTQRRQYGFAQYIAAQQISQSPSYDRGHKGTLSVKVLRASHLKDSSWVSQNPYVVMSVDDEKEQQGAPIPSGGTEPRFDQAFLFQVKGTERNLKISLKHSGPVLSSTIGTATVPISSLTKLSRPEWFPLDDDNGQIELEAQFSIS